MTADQLTILAVGSAVTIFPLSYAISAIADIIAEKKERTRIARILEGRENRK